MMLGHGIVSMDPSPPGFVRLSTDQLPERDRVEVQRELFGRGILKIELEPLPDSPFRVDMSLWALPELGIASGTFSAMRCARPPSLVGGDELVLTVAQAGGGVFRMRGGEAEIGNGSAVLVSGAEPGTFTQTQSRMLTFRLSRERLAPLIADLDATMLRPIPAGTEALRMLVKYAGAVQDEKALATPELRQLVVTYLHDLAALALGATREAAVLAVGRGVRAARLRAVKADVVAHLSDQALSLHEIATRQGISSVYVRKLFADEGTSFTDFVLAERLARAHRRLVDPRFARRTVSDIAFACGFGDLSYFNRAFRRRYGMTPSNARVRAQDRT
jgi:AraC-like DNA-binding protein